MLESPLAIDSSACLPSATLEFPPPTFIASNPTAVFPAPVVLNVSAPFHCALMQPAADQLTAVLREDDFSDPTVPVYTNVDASPVSDRLAARDALLRQVASPVRWTELIERMIEDGFDTFIEIGPGNVLSGLMRRIRKGTTCYSVSSLETLNRAVEALRVEA